VEVTLERGKQAQVLTRQEAVCTREAALKLQRKEYSLSFVQNPTISWSTSHSICYCSDWASQRILYQGIKNFKNSSCKDYKILYGNNTLFFHMDH